MYGEEHRSTQGGFVFVPMGVPHRILTTGADDFNLLVIITPPPEETAAARK
ncbi:MAG: hypothetical protein KJ720_13390 [Proteobacteria bacterium]|nr:hypothetical protein [Pseudomonadota bacterium]